MESSYIKAYRNVFSPSLCKNLIETYEKLWREREEEIKKMSLCYTEEGVKKCGACDCQRLDIMQHKEFNQPFKVVMNGIQSAITQYKKDVKLHSTQWPEKYGYEHLRIKRYLCDENQQHDFHSDVNNIESTKRFLAIVCYLNDEFDEGETEFPHFGLKVKPLRGTILLFPCTWSYLHKGNPSTNGYAKYILGSFLNYTTHQQFNRMGDKNLGIDNI
tara:strand:- start:82 stop:729 length:648 start_codon:yes stop_codon:yes gene_type:complete